MIVETAQMLSTAHRVIDGKENVTIVNGRKKKTWIHPAKNYEDILYKVAHVNHPSSIWIRENVSNYFWAYELFASLCKEYTHRYKKVHSTGTKLLHILAGPPSNLVKAPITLIPLAMKSNPECMFPDDPLKSYRMFYQTKQSRFKMTWTKRDVPYWFIRK